MFIFEVKVTVLNGVIGHKRKKKYQEQVEN